MYPMFGVCIFIIVLLSEKSLVAVVRKELTKIVRTMYFFLEVMCMFDVCIFYYSCVVVSCQKRVLL
jgi:hypothetical protein